MSALSQEAIESISHSLGLARGRKIYRNYYAASWDDQKTMETINALVSRGLMIRGKDIPDAEVTRMTYYHVSRAGAAAIGRNLPREDRHPSERADERPVLFSGEMVRAILDGRKTVTRRPLKPQPHPLFFMRSGFLPKCDPEIAIRADGSIKCGCSPYGWVGDRLWVRETWRRDAYDPKGIIYLADMLPSMVEDTRGIISWKPSIHMLRSASRILLEIVGVSLQQIQGMTEADAIKEGCAGLSEFRRLWSGLNSGINDGWYKNPWVWVIEFRRLAP